MIIIFRDIPVLRSKKHDGITFLDLKTGISLVVIIIGQHMGCLVKAGIQGNKKGLWSDTIFVLTEQLETENQ